MSIRVWDYSREYEELREEILAAVDGVFRSGRLVLSRQVEGFEAAFARYCGVAHGVGLNSGTDALFLVLEALGIGEGDEVVTVPNTAVPTVAAIESTGATARFVDVHPDTCLMDVSRLEAVRSPRTKCVVPVHLYGQCVDMDALSTWARGHDVTVLEDCAHAAGALQHGRKAGSLGDVAAHSFYPTKLLGAYGDGGMVVTDDEALATAVRSLRFYGMSGVYYSERHGYNSRLDEVQAAILALKLQHLDRWIERRRQIAAVYAEQLAGLDLVLPVEREGNRHAYYLYVVRHPERERVLAALAERGIFVNVSYPHPIHTMRGYAHLGYGEGDFPITEQLAREVFSLPMYPHLEDSEQLAVCAALREILS